MTDFAIADRFGLDAVRDTYNRAFNEWKDNVVYLTELTMVLNWRIWLWYDKDRTLAELYNELWEKADAYCMEHFKGEDLQYFLDTTD